MIGGTDGLAATARPGLAVVEAGTLPLAVKESARGLLARRGAAPLDCPISGTWAQLRAKDVVVYASGDAPALARVGPVLAAFSRDWLDLGSFGNGTRLKLVANLLVAIHNVAAAEALLVAERAGLDPRAALAALTVGAGTSRMLEVRGPLMLGGGYGEATMRVQTFAEDSDIISGFARDLGCPTPLFAAAAQVHLAALAQGTPTTTPPACSPCCAGWRGTAHKGPGRQRGRGRPGMCHRRARRGRPGTAAGPPAAYAIMMIRFNHVITDCGCGRTPGSGEGVR